MSLIHVFSLLAAVLCMPAMANPNASTPQNAPYDVMGTPAHMQQKRALAGREDRPVTAVKGGGVDIQASPEQRKSTKSGQDYRLRFNPPKP